MNQTQNQLKKSEARQNILNRSKGGNGQIVMSYS